MARIVQLANFVAPLSGGIRTTLDAFGAGYEAAGHERLLVVPGPEDAIDGHRIVLRGPRIPGQPYRVLVDVERVRQVVRGLRPDRVEVSDKLTLRSIGRLGTPSVLLSHERIDAILRPRVPGVVPLGRIGDAVNRRLAAAFDRVVCASSFSAEEWRRVGVEPVVVPLGVDLEVFRPDAAPPGPPARAAAGRHDVELVTVGRLSTEKRPDRALDAVAGLRAAGVDAALTFVGDGPLRRRLDQSARRRRLPVRFAGHLAERAAVAGALASADVAVCPCPHETFGLAALEALASGTPIAVPRGGALSELVRGGGVGGRGPGLTACGAVDDDLAATTRACLASASRSAARRRAEDFPWSRSVAGMLAAHGLEGGTGMAGVVGEGLSA
jgi:alpha-1,6-mannosyltransferase